MSPTELKRLRKKLNVIDKAMKLGHVGPEAARELINKLAADRSDPVPGPHSWDEIVSSWNELLEIKSRQSEVHRASVQAIREWLNSSQIRAIFEEFSYSGNQSEIRVYLIALFMRLGAIRRLTNSPDLDLELKAIRDHKKRQCYSLASIRKSSTDNLYESQILELVNILESKGNRWAVNVSLVKGRSGAGSNPRRALSGVAIRTADQLVPASVKNRYSIITKLVALCGLRVSPQLVRSTLLQKD